MKHAVILAHPRSQSFNASVARRCMTTLSALGHAAVLRDLYALDFDPRLKAEEISDGYTYEAAADTLAEREALKDVGSFILVYPFWFNGPPAILKGYIDRVFGLGFGTLPRPGGAEPLLKDSSLLSFSTSGAPDHWVRGTGALDGLITMVDTHVAGVCGMSLLGHHHFGGVVPGMRDDAGDEILDQVEGHLRSTFGGKS